MTFDPVINLTASLILSYVFVLAAFHKWQNIAGFADTLKNYRIMPDTLSGRIVNLVPSLELVTGIFLLVPVMSLYVALSAAGLLLLYTMAIGINLLRGRRSIDCGCGAADSRQAISEWLLLRNGVLLALAWVVLNPVVSRSLVWFDWVVIVLATAMGCLFYNIVNQLLVNRGLLKTLESRHG